MKKMLGLLWFDARWDAGEVLYRRGPVLPGDRAIMAVRCLLRRAVADVRGRLRRRAMWRRAIRNAVARAAAVLR